MASVSGATSSLGNTSLRGYGGLASGIDRDSIIEQMTAGTQSKITSQQSKMTSLTWKQEAMRAISSQLLDFEDKYFSYSGGKNLKDASVFARNRISVLGHDDSTKFVKASGTSNMVDYLSILGVKQMASSTTLLSSSKASQNIKTGITEDSLTETVYKTSKLSGTKLEFGTYGTEDKFISAGTFTFPASYTEKQGDKEVTVTLDYTADMDALDENGVSYGQKLAEGLNKALAQSNIKSGDDKIADVMEFKYEGGKMALQAKDGKSTDLVIYSASSALTALGYDATDKDGSKGVTLEMLADKQKDFRDTYAYSQNMNDYLAGKKLSVSFGGQTKEVELVKSGEKFSSLEDMRAAMQKRLDQAFGKDNIAVVINNDTLEFGLGSNATPNQTLTITSTSDEVRKTLGLQKGASNKLSADSSIRNNLDKLMPNASEEEKQAFLEDLNTNGLVINGVKISGVTADTSINDMIEKINNNKDAGVKASYLSGTNQFLLVASETGKGREITLGNDASKTIFGVKTDTGYADSTYDAAVDGAIAKDGGSLEAGKNAEILVSYGNGVKTMFESSSNTFELEGMKVTVSGLFGDIKEDGNGGWTSDTSRAVTFSAAADVDGVTETVKKFFEEYNALVTEVNKQITTRPDSSYGPLTDAQKAEMDETSIENWEKKAKEGSLYNNEVVRSLSIDLQAVLTNMLSNGISYQDLEEIGITMSDDVYDGGTLTFDEAKFKAAMTNDPDKVAQIFTGGGSARKGLTGIIEDTMTVYATRYRSDNGDSYGRLIEEAGSEKLPLSVMNNEIFRQLEDMQEVLDKFKTQLLNEQDRYIRQFSTMETLISQMNSQSSFLSQLTA